MTPEEQVDAKIELALRAWAKSHKEWHEANVSWHATDWKIENPHSKEMVYFSHEEAMFITIVFLSGYYDVVIGEEWVDSGKMLATLERFTQLFQDSNSKKNEVE